MAMYNGDTSNSSGINDAETDKWYKIIKDAKPTEEELKSFEWLNQCKGQEKSFNEFGVAHWMMIPTEVRTALGLNFPKFCHNPQEGNTQRKWIKCDISIHEVNQIPGEQNNYLPFSVKWGQDNLEIGWITLLRTLSQYFTQDELEFLRWTITTYCTPRQTQEKAVIIRVDKTLTEKRERIKKAKVILLRKVFSKTKYLNSSMSQVPVATIPETNIVEIFPIEEHADSTNLVNNNNNEYTFDQSDSMDVQQSSTSSQSYESMDNIGGDECNQSVNFGVQTTRNNNNLTTKKRKLDQTTFFENTSPVSASSQENSSAPSTDGNMYLEHQFDNLTCAACGNDDLINADYLVIHHNLKVVFDVVARHYYHTSDRRLKCDIEQFNGAIEILLQLDPKCFRWKSSEPFSDPIIGLIAQEVQKVAPSLVKEGQDGYLSIDYGQIIVILIEATKQLLSDIHASNDEQEVLQNSLRLLEEEFKGLFNTVSKVVQNQQRQQGFNEERLIRLETRLTHLENDNNFLFLTNCMQIENIFTTLEHGHKLKMTQISIFESLVLEKQNWTRTERQNLMLKLVFLFPLYVGNFTRKQVYGILKQIQSVTLWTNAETDAMVKLCIGVLLYNSGRRSKAEKKLQQFIDDSHNQNFKKTAMAYQIAIQYSNNNEEDAMRLTDRLQSMLPNDKEKNYYGNQIAMMRVSFFFKQKQVEKMEQAISKWAKIVTDETKGESTEHKNIYYVPIDVSQADCHILRNNYVVAEQILKDCLIIVGDSHHYTPLLKSKLRGVLTKQHNYDGAISLAKDLLLMERNNRNCIGILSELKNMVNLCYASENEWNEGLEDNFNFVVKLMKENNEDYALHDELLRLVRELTMDVCHKLKQTEKGIELLHTLINVLECIPTKDPEGKKLVYQDLGMLYYEQRDLDNAEKYFSQCHAYADGSTNIQYKLDSIQNLARVYIDRSDWEKAHRWTYQQISLLNGSKDRVQDYQARKFNALFQLFEICLKLQHWKWAESCLCDCLKLATLPAKQLVYCQFMALYGDERAWISLGRKYCASNLRELANQSEADGQKLLNLITDNKKKYF